MKIKHLTIYNLNSLFGKWQIPFDREPFTNTGLFAITGPTGAGKSTIFDAICLALYGRTPRLKNPEEIMSRHTGECFAELTFSVNGKPFRSRWEQRRSRGKADGKMQGSKMFLQALDGNKEELLEEKKSAVPLLIARITGLDYDQFTRSILLAQGNFASFLKAGINDRADLLEKMTGTDIYSRISIEAFNRSKEEDEKLIRLKEKSGDTEVLSETERNELLQEKLNLSEKRDLSIKTREKYIHAKSWLDQEVLMKLRLDNSLFDFDKAKSDAQDLSCLEVEYEKSNTILQNAALYKQKNSLKKELSELNHSITEQIAEKKFLEDNLDQMESSLNKSLEEQKKQLAFANELVDKKEKLAILENSLSSVEDLIEQTESTIEEKREKLEKEIQKASQINENLNKKREDQSQVLVLLEEKKTYENVLHSLPLLKDLFSRHGGDKILNLDEINIFTETNVSNFEELKQLNRKIEQIEQENPGNIEEYQQLRELMQNLGPISKRYRDILKQKELYSLNKKSYSSELADILKEKDKTLSKKRALEEVKNQADLNNLVNQVQNHLHDGDTCPVCLGTYKDQKKAVKISFDNAEMQIIVDRLLKLNAREDTLNQLICDAQNNDKAVERELFQLLEEWNTLKNSRFGNLEPWEKDRANKLYLENEQKIHDCKIWSNELRLLEEERSQKEKEIQLNQDNHNIIRQILEILGEDFRGTVNINDLIKESERYEKCKRLCEDQITSISSLTNTAEVVSQKIESIKEMIQSLGMELEKNRSKKDTLKVEIIQLSEGKDSEELKRTIESIRFSANENVDKNRSDLFKAKEALSILKNSLEQKRQRIPVLESTLIKVHDDFRTLLLEKNIEETDFERENLIDTVEKVRKEISLKKENLIRTEESYKQSMNSLMEHQKIKPDDTYMTEAISAIEQNDIIIENSSREIGVIEEKISRDDLSREKIREIVEDIKKQERECYGWVRLKSLIGSADGKLYRRFVQGLTLEKLVRLANNHLLKINKRYKIERAKDKELELEVVDGWQADTKRSVSTLSGGESFLVSLALSLGLSDLVGNKVVIDSLFLDEGFGTLDPDSLDTVLAALETLQASGKMIGIISHVAAIRERISVQIRVHKQAGGKSSIEIV